MPRARKHLVCLNKTPYYHVTSRCVRRAFLCGVDRETGRSYEHRRGWIEDRVRVLSSLFSITLCAFAVMSNHYHLVVRLNPEVSDGWNDDQVLKRWTTLFRGPLLVQRFLSGEQVTAAEAITLHDIAAVYRTRLGSLSWFMKCLNEPIARQANAEDSCTGHFWEARFHSQALRTNSALLAAMAYVDLNPIRAGIAETPEHSEYTSIKARIEGHYRASTLNGAVSRLVEQNDIGQFEFAVRPLMRFSDESRNQSESTLPIKQHEYLNLVDQTGRIVVHGKRGLIDDNLDPILERLGLAADDWLRCSTAFRCNYRNGKLRIALSA